MTRYKLVYHCDGKINKPKFYTNKHLCILAYDRAKKRLQDIKISEIQIIDRLCMYYYDHKVWIQITNTSTICRVCSRQLTDAVSIKRKIGPVCWKKQKRVGFHPRLQVYEEEEKLDKNQSKKRKSMMDFFNGTKKKEKKYDLCNARIYQKKKMKFVF